ncbi:hypothetical protein ES703_68338 [subsurface metagenome]
MKKIINTSRIKIVAAILLLICLILPLSSCSRYVDSEGKTFYSSSPRPDAQRITEYYYIWTEFEAKELGSWVLIICFIWPIPIIIYKYRGQRKRVKQILWAVEPLLIIGTVYYIAFSATFLSDPEVGYYLAVTANGIYGIAWLWEAIIKCKYKRSPLTT